MTNNESFIIELKEAGYIESLNFDTEDPLSSLYQKLVYKLLNPPLVGRQSLSGSRLTKRPFMRAVFEEDRQRLLSFANLLSKYSIVDETCCQLLKGKLKASFDKQEKPKSQSNVVYSFQEALQYVWEYRNAQNLTDFDKVTLQKLIDLGFLDSSKNHDASSLLKDLNRCIILDNKFSAFELIQALAYKNDLRVDNYTEVTDEVLDEESKVSISCFGTSYTDYSIEGVFNKIGEDLKPSRKLYRLIEGEQLGAIFLSHIEYKKLSKVLGQDIYMYFRPGNIRLKFM